MAGVCTNPTHGHGESAVPDFMGEMPDSPSEEWNPCHAAGDTASSWGGGGGGWILPPHTVLGLWESLWPWHSDPSSKH